MRVSVFGVGYVGCVSAACLAREGHEVIGVDVNAFKVNEINEGRSPFFEPGLGELVSSMVATGRLRATTDDAFAIENSDVALICVGTPTGADGSTCLDALKQVLSNVARQLRSRKDYFVVAIRSTVLPTMFSEVLIPILERYSGKTTGKEIGFVYNPEFLREGVALQDFHDAPWTIIGAMDHRAAEMVEGLYAGLASPVVKTDPGTAALVKYFSNAFHALKVAFGNEVGSFCREMGVDGAEMMEIFSRDTKLNISRRYLKPGFAFGGSCLPKDLKALLSETAKRGLKMPLLESVLPSNDAHLRNCIEAVREVQKQRIGLVGLSFKAGTDDLRESPAVELAERLIGKGYDVRIYEPSIAPGRLHGTNLQFLERTIPHIWKLLVGSLEELFAHAEAIVVMQQLLPADKPSFRKLDGNHVCIDLARALNADAVQCEYRTMDAPLGKKRSSETLAEELIG